MSGGAPRSRAGKASDAPPHNQALRHEPVFARHRRRRKPHRGGGLPRSRETLQLVLTNSPFGKKRSITIVNRDGKADRESLTYNCQDFSAPNFLQHVKTLLEIKDRAAIVLPDNVLFEGGAGEAVRRKLLQGVTFILRFVYLRVYSTPRGGSDRTGFT